MPGALLAKIFWWKLLLYAAVAWIVLCGAGCFAQRRMLYFPSRQQNPLPAGFEAWPSPDGKETWGYRRLAGKRECLFFFHGNGGNASGWAHAVEEFPGDIFVLEYPGYGQRPGSPTERSIKEAALKGFEAEAGRYANIVLAGQSLGGGVTEAIFTKHP